MLRVTKVTVLEVEVNFLKEKRKIAQSEMEYSKSINSLRKVLANYDENKGNEANMKNDHHNSVIRHELENCKKIGKDYRSKICKVKILRAEYLSSIKFFLEIWQKEEEKVLDRSRKAIKAMLNAEQALTQGNDMNFKEIADKLNNVSLDQELFDMNAKMKEIEMKIEKVCCLTIDENIKVILEKYEDYCSERGSAENFDIDEIKNESMFSLSIRFNKEKKDITNKVMSIIENCWKGNDFIEDDSKWFKDCLKNKENREIFCFCMNYYRKNGEFVVCLKGYKLLSKLLIIYIDAAEIDMDVASILDLIILSETYYCTFKNDEDVDTKIFLQEFISYHPFLRSEKLWNYVLETQLKEIINNEIEAIMSEEKMNKFFCNLSTYSHNMVNFGMDRSFIEGLIQEYASKCKISSVYKENLNVIYK